MNSLAIYNPSDRLDIRPKTGEIRRAIAERQPIRWYRDGMVGTIPLAVIEDTIRVQIAYEELRARGRIPELPPEAYTIHWRQVVHVRSESDPTQPLS